MLVTVVLDGYFSSSSPSIRPLVNSLLRQHALNHRPKLEAKSSIWWSRSRRFRSYIKLHAHKDNCLLAIGKSLGAKHMVDRVLNKLPFLRYSEVAIVTVDPNWALMTDWTPNLNDVNLYVTYPVDYAANVYVIGSKRQQCGAKLKAKGGAKNYPVLSSNHYNIIEHPFVERELNKAINWLKEKGHV